MACLQQQVEFENAMTAMSSFDDFETAVGLGQRLLDDQGPNQLALLQRIGERTHPEGGTARHMKEGWSETGEFKHSSPDCA